MLVQPSTGAALTEREREVARLVSEGHSRKAIAQQLDISIATVDYHLDNAAKKIPGNGRPSLRIARFVLVQCSTAPT